jgi:poly(beta-D-mannuronate) lyase
MMSSHLALPALLTVLLVHPSFAGEYLVSSAAAIAQAMATAQPGDTLTMTDGAWTNQEILFQGNGASGNPIVLRARSHGAVTLGGTSRLQIAGDYLVAENLVFQGGNSAPYPVVEFRNGSLESNHSRLTRCSISNYSPPDVNTDNKWVSLYGTYNRVDHCALSGKTNSGTTLVVWLTNHPNYHLIDYNYFGPRPYLGFNGGETIRVGTSDWSMYDSYTTVEYNLFDRCNGETEIISSKSCENVYWYNTFRSCQGTLTLRHGNRCTVEGNFFFGNGVQNSGGIRIIGEDHRVINNYVTGTAGTSYRAALTMMNGVPNSPLNRYFQVKRALVAFNTFVDNRMTFHIGAGKDSELTLPPLDCTIADNILIGTSSPFFTMTDTPVNMTYEGNIYFGATLGVASTGFTQVDPRLAPAGSDGLRHLRNDSPAINASVGSYPFVVDDMDGQPRDTLLDTGADEYSTAGVVRRPLTIADVGPGAGTTDITPPYAATGPDAPRLMVNYPNPFNPVTHIEFEVPGTGWAVVRVFNVLGQQVGTLFDGEAVPHRTYRLSFDAGELSAGTYFSRLEFGGRQVIRPMMLVK